jgi:hypothetical protein
MGLWTRVIELTRRRYLCLTFGYLTFISLFLYLLGLGTVISVRSVKVILPEGDKPEPEPDEENGSLE